jgi:hypothetical protein
VKRGKTETTNKQMKDLLPKVMQEISALQRDRPDLILEAWADIIGEKLAPMTKPVGFENGILTVKVSNSTLYSLLSQHERSRLVLQLKKRFPAVEIKNIYFRMG